MIPEKKQSTPINFLISILEKEMEGYAKKGYRTLAVAVERKGSGTELIGVAAHYDAPRPESAKLIAELKKWVNDAPALRQAKVGIAVSNATYIAKGAASVFLTHEGLAEMVELVKTGRQIHQRISTWILNKIIKIL